MKIVKKNNSLIISLSGEIDDHSTMDIKYIMDSEYESSKMKNMIFDFSNVDFMDSSGVGLIIGRYKVVAKTGGKMAVVGASGIIDRIMDMSGVYKLARRCDTLGDAFKALG